MSEEEEEQQNKRLYLRIAINRHGKNNKIQKQYFSAGGNGVAMRILPHCIQRAEDRNFDGLFADIIKNGVTTHGHCRALIGALVFGYSVFYCLNKVTELTFGELITVLRDNQKRMDEFK